MGNVQQKGKENGLSVFQRKKLKYDFYTYFGRYNIYYIFFIAILSLFKYQALKRM